MTIRPDRQRVGFRPEWPVLNEPFRDAYVGAMNGPFRTEHTIRGKPRPHGLR